MGNLPEAFYDFTPQCPHLRWLCDHLDGWQFGDQGLIEAITTALELKGIAIEYGAGDGETLPLTIERLYDAGMKCFLYEIDSNRRDQLRKRYPNAWVSKTTNWKNFPDANVVVIDIDSHDSVVMREMLDAGVRPALLVVEHMDRHYPIGTSLPELIPQWMLGLKLESCHAIQDTAETLQAMAGQYGYERIGFNRVNSYFVRAELFPLLFR
jgi:hypothetical protein